MKTYLLDILSKVKRYSKSLDDQVLFLNQRWVIFDENSNTKNLFIFRENNELLIAVNGDVRKAKWEYIDSSTILIKDNELLQLYRHGFMDNSILALCKDGDNKYLLFFNESVLDVNFKDLTDINYFLEKRYGSESIAVKNFSKLDSKKAVGRSIKTFKDLHFCVFDSDKGPLEIEQNTTYPNLYKGQKVKLNDESAPDGKYSLGVIGFIKVKDGLIEKAKMI